MAELIDAEIQSQLLSLEKATLDFLASHRSQLEALAQAVLKQESLSAEEIRGILEQSPKETAAVESLKSGSPDHD